jgi:hypothetical protein
MGARSYWVAPVPPQNFADGTAFTGLTLQDISPTPARTIGAFVPEQGTGLRLRAFGEYTSTSATPTLTLGFYWGGFGGVALAAATGVAISASAVAWPWMMEWEGEFRLLGGTGSVKGMGLLRMGSSLTAFNAEIGIPATQALRTVTVSTAAAQAVTVGANWSSATGTPSITCYRLLLEMVG